MTNASKAMFIVNRLQLQHSATNTLGLSIFNTWFLCCSLRTRLEGRTKAVVLTDNRRVLSGKEPVGRSQQSETPLFSPKVSLYIGCGGFSSSFSPRKVVKDILNDCKSKCIEL